MLAHGFYDFCLSAGSLIYVLAILIVEIAIFVYCIKKINKISKENNHILNNPEAAEENQQVNMINNQNRVLNNGTNQPRFCRNCGSPINGAFCSHCGSKQ